MVKIFAHRGYDINGIEENTIKSLDLAYQNNFSGIEFDIHYINNKLVITHDDPNLQNISDFDVFHEFLKYGNSLLYWLDFKNLQNLDRQSLKSSLEMLKRGIQDRDCNIDKFYFAPYITDINVAESIYNAIREVFSVDVQIMAVCDNIKKEQYEEYNQWLISQSISNLSIRYDLIDQDLIDILQKVEIFAWTVNEKHTADQLVDRFKIANFTTDNITPKMIGQ